MKLGKPCLLGLFSPTSASPSTSELLFPFEAAQLAGIGQAVVSQWENQGFGWQIRAGMAVEEDCDRSCSEQPWGQGSVEYKARGGWFGGSLVLPVPPAAARTQMLEESTPAWQRWLGSAQE